VFTATFEADARHAAYARERRWHPDQESVRRRDGTVRFTLPFGDFGEAARWIRGHGPGFVPITPNALVQEWKRQIGELVARSGS
jgi:hypothetical protein